MTPVGEIMGADLIHVERSDRMTTTAIMAAAGGARL
jgi:hypothetical protein